MAGQELVRVYRDIPDADEVGGYVLDAGTRKLLLARFGRKMLASTVTSPFDSHTSTTWNAWVRPATSRAACSSPRVSGLPPAISAPFTATSDLVRGAGELSPLVQIHIEREEHSL